MVLAMACALAALVLDAGQAFSAHPGSAYLYSTIGFSPDGKYAYFERDDQHPYSGEVWLRVTEVATGKVIRSTRVFRWCPDFEGESQCDRGRPISKAYGARIRTGIYNKFGVPTKHGPPTIEVDQDQAIAGAIGGAGFEQVWTIRGSKLRTTLRRLDPAKLPDPTLTGEGRTNYQLTVAVKGPAGKRMGTMKVWTEAIPDTWNANIMKWPELYVQDLALSPTNDTVALVFGRKPFIVALAPEAH